MNIGIANVRATSRVERKYPGKEQPWLDDF